MDRRSVERRVPHGDEPICRVRLRTGRELSVIDVSNGGALVEGARLLPGTHLDVHVTTRDGRVLVRSRVVRAYVAALRADGIRYRGALAFEGAVDTSCAAGYAMPSRTTDDRGRAGTDYPPVTSSSHTSIDHRLTA